MSSISERFYSVRSLFAATILAVNVGSLSTPAIANTLNELPVPSPSSKLNIIAAQPKAILQNSGSNQFARRSLNLAKQIPSDAIGFLILDIDRSSWQVLGSSSVSPVLALDKLLSFITLSSGFSITKDVQPWLGNELAISLWGNGGDSELSFVALAPIADSQKFELFLQKLKKLNLPKPTEIQYQNVKILEWQFEEEKFGDRKPVLSQRLNSRKYLLSHLQDKASELQNADLQNAHLKNKDLQNKDDYPPNSGDNEPIIPGFFDFRLQRLAIAQLPSGVAVIATDRQAIQKMVDLSAVNSEQTLPSLAENPLFLRSLNHPLWDRSLLAGYGDFKGLGQIAEILAADLPETSEVPGLSRSEYLQGLQYTLGQYSSFDLFTWLDPKGVRSQSNSYFAEVRPPVPKDNGTSDRLLSYLPSNIYGAITSRNFSRQWQWFVEESKKQPSYKILVDGLRMLSSSIADPNLDLDIEKDIIALMDGEYAVTIFPSDRSPFKEFGSDIAAGMLIRTSKPDAVNKTLGKVTKYFNNFLVPKNIAQVKKRQIGTTLLTSLEFPDDREVGKTQSAFAYGWRDPQTLILTIGYQTVADFIPTPKPALADSEMFRDAITDMPKPNFGYFYLNANAIAKQIALFSIAYFSELEASPNPESPQSETSSPDQSTKKVLPELLQKTIDRLGGAVFVYSETSDRFQADFFLGLKP
ncbi:DUF3352 domain-containing protein [Pseudanabaena sp. UWO310]|nr:DUF3352 domain-containing protein [Pseudanabaena sp. UWO310]